MKEMERQVMCVLLHALLDKNLITQRILVKAKSKILRTLDEPDFFFYREDERKEESHGHTQNSC